MNEQKTKNNRLTKKQSVILLVVAIIIWFISSKSLNNESILITGLNAAATLSAIFAILSLLTKNGLRWK